MTSLKFGTSGLRGLVTDLQGWPSHAYALAFLKHVAGTMPEGGEREVLIGRDLRSSSPEIARLAASAARRAGFSPRDCGAVPTPALALAAMSRGAPAIMVTGSHIPDDRNGLKFYRPDGEISKADEAGILSAFASLSDAERRPDEAGPAAEPLAVAETYAARYTEFFGPQALSGLAVGVYQHSSVARDLLTDILGGLGATVVRYGRAEAFIPVDTEAHRPEDLHLLAGWAAEQRCDAFVSTDGDADRPLVADRHGTVLRGDVLGLLTARHLGLSTLVTPVTSSSAIERSGIADSVIRTRVGSPFVIAGMAEAAASGASGIVGFEANGGLLLGSDIVRDGRRLAALPTRDAVLPIAAVLAEMARTGKALADLVADLDAGHAAAHRLPEVKADRSGPFLSRLAEDSAWREAFFAPIGRADAVDGIDGVRVTLESGAVVHYRASGNAPELRCYVEAGDAAKAQRLLTWGLDAAAKAMDPNA
ncbi:phosphomannomutase [Aurantimonas sp. VKM B-3413]|uniref:phosphomannomutase n=1 Tax=Aurantimonas sp. VKM B-3413 TaxID=2779401 RepID=UPI001E518483|nr:phosphomannomutase [Aurantimonas sp. VKM B-3413]MCB8835903.1 phosphomannomutase [Aurantimonas sp. VKM B-3413]